jgi:transposase
MTTIKEFIAAMRQETDPATDEELRGSLSRWGWIQEFPALQDEDGETLVGNRRLRIARELKIEPCIKVLTLGRGEAGDAERLKLALASNIGGRPLTAEVKKRLAVRLAERGWTQADTGNALGVSQQAVAKYLADQSLQPGSKPPPRPKGGRPKSPPKPKRPAILTSEQETQMAQAVLDEGKPRKQVEQEFGVSNIVTRRVIAAERGRREALADPPIDPATLSLSAQEKLAAAIRQHARKLNMEYDRLRREEVERHIKNVLTPLMQEKLDEADRVIKARRGLMTRSVYKKIWACLHPDRLAALRAGHDLKLEERYAEAFDLFSKLEVVLLNEKEMPTQRIVLTAEMLAARKAQVQAERRAQRAAKSNSAGLPT